MVLREDRLGATARRRRGVEKAQIQTDGTVDYLYMSADNHMDLIWYPRDIIQSRISPKYREAAPKVVEAEQGTSWEWEGSLHAFSADGKDWAKYARRFDPIVVPDGKLPPTDPEILLQHLDIGKTWAGVFFGNTRKWTFKDKEMEKEIYRVFNDWALELSSTSPDRIIALPWMHSRFPELCAPEVYRLAEQGARAIEFSFSDAEMGAPLWSPEWEPFWSAAAETGVVVCSHVGDAAGTPYPPNEYGQSLAHFSQVPFIPVGKHIAQVVFSGVFDRHPELKVGVAECRIGWLPFLFQWMDRCYNDRLPDSIYQNKEAPTHYVRNNMWFTFEEDYVGGKMLGDPELVIGDCAIWGADYPHEQGQTWPDAGPAMERLFAGVSDELRHEIVWGRTQRLFGIHGPDVEPAV